MMKEEVEWRIPLLLWRSHIFVVPPQRDLVKHGISIYRVQLPFLSCAPFQPCSFQLSGFFLFEFGGTRTLHLAALFTRLTNLRHH